MLDMLPEWSYPQLLRELREWACKDIITFENNKNLQRYDTEKSNNEQSEQTNSERRKILF